MAEFYIESKPKETGERLVHKSTCSALPSVDTMAYLGSFGNVAAPINKSRTKFALVSGCPVCIAS